MRNQENLNAREKKIEESYNPYKCGSCSQFFRVSKNLFFKGRFHSKLVVVCPHCKRKNIARYFEIKQEKAQKTHSQTQSYVPTKSIFSGHSESVAPPQRATHKGRKRRVTLRDFIWGKNTNLRRDFPLKIKQKYQNALAAALPLFIVLGLFGILGIISAPVYLRFTSLILLENPKHYLVSKEGYIPNVILDRNQKLISELFNKKSNQLNFNEIPMSLVKKIVFVEDKYFWKHNGIHWPSVLRAFIINLVNLGYKQGGSTITQQLARTLLEQRKKTIFRKIRESSLAYYLEENLTKQEILSAYLGLIYFGHGVYGIQNAAQFFFNKNMAELTFEEELVLVCLPSAPRHYSPLRNSKRLNRKMQLIYNNMQKTSSLKKNSLLHKKELYKKRSSQLLRSFSLRSPYETVKNIKEDPAPYVSEHIRRKLKELFGEKYVYSAGLTIETTIDLEAQRKIGKESLLFSQRNSKRYPPKQIQYVKQKKNINNKQASVIRAYKEISIATLFFNLLPELPEPPDLGNEKKETLQIASVGLKTGSNEILFMQGGSDFNVNNQLNRVTQMIRQPGSAIKPIIYASAIDKGLLHAASILEDKPIYVKKLNNYWIPRNINNVYSGLVSVRTALVKSQNIPAIQIGRKLGLDGLKKTFKDFFFPKESILQKRFRKDETIVLGSLDISPIELALAYSSFTNNGYIHRPILIKKITDSKGKLIYEKGINDEFSLNIPKERKVIRGDSAEVMISLLKQSAKNGGVWTGGLKKNSFFGKTGTTNSSRDAWFVGGTADLVTAVWVGYDKANYAIRGGSGTALAGPLWGLIMKHASASISKAEKRNYIFFPTAKRLQICAGTDTLYFPECPSRPETELFTAKLRPRTAPRRQKKEKQENEENRAGKGKELRQIKQQAQGNTEAAPSKKESGEHSKKNENGGSFWQLNADKDFE